MTLKELRISKRLTQVDASEICHIPLRSYKRIESDVSYVNSYKYKNAFKCLENYHLNKSKDKSHNVLVIGAGYVGFSLAVLLSKTNDVTIVDIKKDKVNKINNREPIFKDKEIAQWLETKELHLKASLPNKELYKNQDYIIVALPTDYDEKTNLLKTDNIVSLVKEIREINKKTLIVIKSTCYVGFTESLNDNNVIFCPEFLREGRALLDNLYPSRIIIGGDPSNKKIKEFGDLLAKSSLNRAKTLYMSAKEAEAVKLFSNAYLALRVAYFNELDSFAMTNEMNSKNIIEGVSLDNRIGDYYNNPSFGYGGYCLPKDTLSLINQMNDVKNTPGTEPASRRISCSTSSGSDCSIKSPIPPRSRQTATFTINIPTMTEARGSSTVHRLPPTSPKEGSKMAPPMPRAVPTEESASLRWCHALASTAGEFSSRAFLIV